MYALSLSDDEDGDGEDGRGSRHAAVSWHGYWRAAKEKFRVT